MLGLGRSHSSDLQARLPRGECRFILLHPEVSGQRCSCQGFWLNNAVPGSSCACGHQACYHVSSASHEGVSREEHEALLVRVARLEAHLEKERGENLRHRVGALEEAVEQGHHVSEEGYRDVHRAIQGVYGHMGQLRRLAADRFMHQEDKIEGLLDQVTSLGNEMTDLRQRVVAIDEITMNLEDRLSDLGENEASGSKDHSSPRQVAPPVTGVEVSTGEASNSWTANVAFIPSPVTGLPMSPYHEGTKAYLRCASRGLIRKVTFKDSSSSSFQRVMEEEFGPLLTGRRWMPLRCTKSSPTSSQADQTLDRLSEDLCQEELWDAKFLQQQHCIFSNGPSDMRLLHVTLRDHVWTWKAIHALPAVKGKEDESYWQYDESIDGKHSNHRTMEIASQGSDISTRKGRSTSLSINPSPPKKPRRRTSSGTFEVPKMHVESGEPARKRIRIWADQPVGQVGRLGVGSCTTAVV
ncbi:MAG: hypothetical protein M1816_000178 [Peltula sp. TS41687]|nr:MAG: hypothetical protein M1816_000178 [Peltula sp. TS41687]